MQCRVSEVNSCLIPQIPHDFAGDNKWMSLHERFLQEVKNSEAEVVWIGDSIIQYLQFTTLWNNEINGLHCLNLGIGGDRVQNVLWRLENGELDFNVKLKAIVLFVGTNNNDRTAREIFEGILNLVKLIKKKLGQDVAVILPTLLPRGQQPNVCRERNNEVNKFILDAFSTDKNMHKNIHVVEIDKNIVQSDGSISHHIMYDYLHLTDAGYSKIFRPVYEKLREILQGENVVV